MSRLKKLGLSVMTNFLAQGVSMILAVVALPVYIHYLGVSGYGVYSFLLVILNYLAFLDIGMNGGAVRFIAEAAAKNDHERIKKIIGSISRLYLVTGGAGASILFFSAGYLTLHYLKDIPESLQQDTILFFRLGGIAFFLNMFIVFITSIPTALQKQYLSNSVRMSGDSLRYISGIILLVMGHGLVALIFSNLIINLGVLGVTWWFSRREIGPFSLFRPFDKVVFKEIISFSVYFMAGSIIGVIAVQINQLVIGWMLPVALLAYYSGAFDTAGKLWMIPRNILSPVFPLWTEMIAKNEIEKIERLLIRSAKFIAMMTLPVIMIFGIDSQLILEKWISAGFSESTWLVFVFLLLGILISNLSYPAIPLSYAFNEPRIVTKNQLLQGVLNISGCFLLIPFFNIEGAGLAFTLTQLIAGPILLYSVLKKTISLTVTDYLKQTLLKPVLAVLFTSALYLVLLTGMSESWLNLLLRMSSMGLLYLILTWFFVLDSEDKRYLGLYTPLGKWFPARFPK